MPAAANTSALTLTGFPVAHEGHAADESAATVRLTRGLAAADAASFREFHACYFDRLYHFLLVVTRGDEHAAQDALQETLCRVARHAREFTREDVFWGWLKAIARNAARDGGRRRRRYHALLERFAFRRPEPMAGEGAVDEARMRELLADCLAQLDPAERWLVESKYLRGASVRELAAETGLTEKAVESRLIRLRRELGAHVLRHLRAP